jgi:hypothetical protein
MAGFMRFIHVPPPTVAYKSKHTPEASTQADCFVFGLAEACCALCQVHGTL